MLHHGSANATVTSFVLSTQWSIEDGQHGKNPNQINTNPHTLNMFRCRRWQHSLQTNTTKAMWTLRAGLVGVRDRQSWPRFESEILVIRMPGKKSKRLGRPSCVHQWLPLPPTIPCKYETQPTENGRGKQNSDQVLTSPPPPPLHSIPFPSLQLVCLTRECGGEWAITLHSDSCCMHYGETTQFDL